MALTVLAVSALVGGQLSNESHAFYAGNLIFHLRDLGSRV